MEFFSSFFVLFLSLALLLTSTHYDDLDDYFQAFIEMIANERNRTNNNNDEIFILFAGHVLLIFYCIIFILGFLGNLAVIYVGIRKKKYRNVTNCYVINLALADLLFLTLSIPYTTYIGLVNNHPFGETICKMYMYLAYVFLLATCHTLSAMSIDRYFYIVIPKPKLQWRTPRNAVLICMIIWIGALVLIIPYHFMTLKLEICGTSDRKNLLICFLIFCSYYAIPLGIITVCYSKLAMHVINVHRLVLNQMNTVQTSESKQRRVTRMVIIVTLSFAICWLPIHILELMKCANSSTLYRLLDSHPKILYTIRALAHALAYINSCLNPYLYALLNRNFCYDLIGVIPSCLTRYQPPGLLQTKNSLPMTKIISSTNTIDEILIKRKAHYRGDNEEDDDDDDEEDDYEIVYHGKNRAVNIDVSCQVNLLQT